MQGSIRGERGGECQCFRGSALRLGCLTEALEGRWSVVKAAEGTGVLISARASCGRCDAGVMWRRLGRTRGESIAVKLGGL